MKHFLFKTIQLSEKKFRVFFSIAYLQNCKCSSLHNGKLQLNELTKMIFLTRVLCFDRYAFIKSIEIA